MTVAELLTEVLAAIRNQLYADKPVAHWFRDKTALTKAISRYGYDCEQRGWEFDVPFIRTEIMSVVQSAKKRDAIAYLPTYLSEAIGRHVREHAEELNAKAKATRAVAAKALGKLHVAPTVPKHPSDTYLLSLLHQQMKTAERKRKARPAAKVKQGELI